MIWVFITSFSVYQPAFILQISALEGLMERIKSLKLSGTWMGTSTKTVCEARLGIMQFL